MSVKREKGDVRWTIPYRKTPIAWSTVATSNLITALMEPNDTIASLRQKINYDVEAKAVLDAYIEKGYGNQIAKEWFR